MTMVNELPPYTIITRTWFFERHSGLQELFEVGYKEEEAFEDDEDFEEEHYAFYFEGDIVLDAGQLEMLDRSPDAYIIAINGNLSLPGKCPYNVYVTGDLHCDVYSQDLYGANILVNGTIFARHCVYFYGEEDEDLHEFRRYPCKVDTPYIFSWFVNIVPILASPETVIFLMCSEIDYKKMKLSNPLFYWHDCIYCLSPGLCYEVMCAMHDSSAWNIDAIINTLQEGQSLFIEGFDMACWPYWQQANKHLAAQRYPQAFAGYGMVRKHSPGWYMSWLKTGELLLDIGAYQQSIPFLEKAVSLFPEKHRQLNNGAADLLALAQLRLRRLDEAIGMAGFSINKCSKNERDTDLFFAYRIRGEGYILKEEWEHAKADLEQALKTGGWNGPAVWLMGLVLYHFGDHAEAEKYRRRAIQNGEQYRAGYDKHQHWDFMYYQPPIVVDWA